MRTDYAAGSSVVAAAHAAARHIARASARAAVRWPRRWTRSTATHVHAHAHALRAFRYDVVEFLRVLIDRQLVVQTQLRLEEEQRHADRAAAMQALSAHSPARHCLACPRLLYSSLLSPPLMLFLPSLTHN